MQNTPALTTERLQLRRFAPQDAAALFAILSDKDVNRFLPMLPLQTEQQAVAYLRTHYLDSYTHPQGFRYAICLKAEDVPIGYVNLSDGESHDLGYGLHKHFWRQGIAAEACARVIQQVKQAGIPYITATHDVNNPASGRVMQKLGMRYCYSYREQWQPKDIFVVFRLYQLNLDGQRGRVYRGYWNQYPEHFIETL